MLVDFGGPENAPSPTCCMEARAISACFSASSCFISACFEGQVPLFGLSFLAEGHHPIWDLNDTVYKALSRQNMSKLLSTLYETNQWLPPQPCFPEKHCYFDKVLFDVVKTNTNTPSSGSRLACAVIPNWSSTNQTAPKDLYS